jgi:hypothetical protein
LASALHGDLDFYAIDAVGFASESVDFGVDEAGANGVDSDFFFGYFFGEADGESVNGAFGGGIVDVFVGGTGAGGSGRNVDDVAALASVFGGHAAHRFAGAEEASEDVDGEDAVEAGGVHGVETGLTFDDAGVVDQGGDGSEAAVGGIEKADDVGFGADVGLDGYGCASFLLDRGYDLIGGALLTEIVDADVESAGGGELGGGGSDAAAGAGDEQDLGWHGGLILNFTEGRMGKVSYVYFCGAAKSRSFAPLRMTIFILISYDPGEMVVRS